MLLVSGAGYWVGALYMAIWLVRRGRGTALRSLAMDAAHSFRTLGMKKMNDEAAKSHFHIWLNWQVISSTDQRFSETYEAIAADCMADLDFFFQLLSKDGTEPKVYKAIAGGAAGHCQKK